jgi:hypothetical protein
MLMVLCLTEKIVPILDKCILMHQSTRRKMTIQKQLTHEDYTTSINKKCHLVPRIQEQQL